MGICKSRQPNIVHYPESFDDLRHKIAEHRHIKFQAMKENLLFDIEIFPDESVKLFAVGQKLQGKLAFSRDNLILFHINTGDRVMIRDSDFFFQTKPILSMSFIYQARIAWK